MIERNVTPEHVAIIMDGNGRWAKERNLPRSYGHREGVKRVKDVVKAAADLGIKVVTFFAFSTENWVRPKKEINMLMSYLNSFLLQEVNQLHKNNMRFKVIGGSDPLPLGIQNKIKRAEAKTAGNTGLTVVLALNYGSRQEIVEAAKNFAKDVASGNLKAEDLDVEKFSHYLYTASLGGVDFLIRTSGEMRISNFLLWQISYAELYFTNKLWPDFKAKDFYEAIDDYRGRERRFGGI